MMKFIKRKLTRREKIFTLAILLLVIVVWLLNKIVIGSSELEKIESTKIKLERIQTALDAYVNQKGHLPCPASRGTTVSSPSYGAATDCSHSSAPSGTNDIGTGEDILRKGVVPTRELGLPDTYMVDAWDNRFTYTVIKNLAVSAGSFDSATPSINAINITDVNGNQINNTAIAYTIVSHGKKSHGATNHNGITSNCPNDRSDSPNCNNNLNTFVDGAFNGNFGTDYDDLVRWKSKSLQIRDSSYSGGVLSSGISFSKFALIADKKDASGANSLAQPIQVTNDWNIRNLNTILSQSTPSPISAVDPINGTFTLMPGNYYIKVTSSAQGVTGNRLRIYNVTTNETEALGLSSAGDINGTTVPATTATSHPVVILYKKFAQPATLRVDHFVASINKNLNGGSISGFELGYPVANSGSQIYTTVEIFGQ